MISTPSRRSTVSDIDTRNSADTDEDRPYRRISALAWRIILFNALALLVLIAGVATVQFSRVSLVQQRLADIKEQATILAGALAEYTTSEDSRYLVKEVSEPLLKQLISPTRLRARLYDTNGKLLTDTRILLSRNLVRQSELPPIGTWGETISFFKRMYDEIIGVRPFTKLDAYFEGGANGRVYSEVNSALSGDTATGERVDDQNRLVLSVAVPVQRLKAIYGVLLVSTEGGDIDIDDILRQERVTLIQVFLVAVAVMFLSSLYLAGTIAEPVRKLAAADRVRRGYAGRENLPHIDRGDEIGDLSASLSAMTRALYDRIDAIERFAADVAHELKNPLTSLRNAVEMLGRAKDDESRDRMMAIVRNDVSRIDRLITDISDASRLDAELSREQRSKVDPAHLLKTIVEIYQVTDSARDVKFSLDLELPPGTEVWGGDERLGHVFRNLIDNAISFSPAGGTVSITARVLHSVVRVMVEDEGPGIPPDNLESIFDRFYTERPADHFGKNSGLGLFIARQVVVKAGGRVWAENRASGGAKFVVELPLASLR